MDLKVSFLPFTLRMLESKPFEHHCLQVTLQDLDCLVEQPSSQGATEFTLSVGRLEVNNIQTSA